MTKREKPQWRDETTYTRTEAAADPKIMSLPLPRHARLVVHRIHPDQEHWYVSLHNIDLDTILLEELDLSKAKEEAVRKIEAYLRLVLNQLRKVQGKR